MNCLNIIKSSDKSVDVATLLKAWNFVITVGLGKNIIANLCNSTLLSEPLALER